MDSLLRRDWVSFLKRVASDNNPWHSHRDPPGLGPHQWTLPESQYSTDIMSKSTKDLQAVYPALLDGTIGHFHCHNVPRFLGRKVRSTFDGKIKSDFRLRREGTRIQHWVQMSSINMYDKQGRGRTFHPLHPIALTDAAVLTAVSHGKFLVAGFRNRDLRTTLHPQAEHNPDSLRISPLGFPQLSPCCWHTN